MGSPKQSSQQGDRQEKKKLSGLRPGVEDYIAGEASDFVRDLSPYLPDELVGGSIPYIAETEEEAVWNAASQACGTEKIHFCYTVEGNRCWYMATASSCLASNPDSWCPLVAALPGNSEYWDKETVYLYEQEGMASALSWDQETGRMKVSIGAGRTLLPRIQSMDAVNFVTINPEAADQVPWQNLALRTEKLSRAAARMLLVSGIVLNLLIFSFLIFQFALTNEVQQDLMKAESKIEIISQNLVVEAHNAVQSDSIKHMVRIQELLDELRSIDGTLVKYEVQGERRKWEVLVPQAYRQGVGSVQGQLLPGIEEDGRVRIKGIR